MRWRARSTAATLIAASLLAGCGSGPGDDPGRREAAPVPLPAPPPGPSRSIGRPDDGRLVGGVQLPEAGRDHRTWDSVRHRVPNRPGRRWAADRLLAFLLGVLRDYRAANPDAPPVLVGDLSRPRGGSFGRAYGGLGHASHQNGLDADVYYPRRDGRLLAARRPSQVDRALAQALVDAFVRAGARFAFVGPRVGLRGPRRIVQAIPHHDDHVHVRLRK